MKMTLAIVANTSGEIGRWFFASHEEAHAAVRKLAEHWNRNLAMDLRTVDLPDPPVKATDPNSVEIKKLHDAITEAAEPITTQEVSAMVALLALLTPKKAQPQPAYSPGRN